MKKSYRFGLMLTPAEKHALERLAELEGGLSKAALIRRLIREAAKRRELWSPKRPADSKCTNGKNLKA